MASIVFNAPRHLQPNEVLNYHLIKSFGALTRVLAIFPKENFGESYVLNLPKMGDKNVYQNIKGL
jgi:hypothetical protein